MKQRMKYIVGLLIILTMYILTIVPDSAKAASSGDFLIKDGVLVAYYGSDKTVTVPDSVKEIGKRAFYYSNKVKTIILPDSITVINWTWFIYMVQVD